MPDEERRVRPGYHDPTYEMAGAAPARSALTLRLVLATFGLIVLGGGAVLLALLGEPAWEVIVVALMAAVALIDLLVVGRRIVRGEPG
jgi:hypothetical protein